MLQGKNLLQGINLPPRNATLQVGSPPPTLACHFCPRHFHSKGGRTKHMQVKHQHKLEGNGLGANPHASNLNLTLSPSPVLSPSHSSSHNVQFKRSPSPIPSDDTPSPPPSPSGGEVDAADIGIGAEYPQLDQDYNPPNFNVGDEQHAQPQANPGAPHITYHPKLNGKTFFLFIHKR